MPRRKYAGRQNVRTKICRRKISRRKNARRKIVRLRYQAKPWDVFVMFAASCRIGITYGISRILKQYLVCLTILYLKGHYWMWKQEPRSYICKREWHWQCAVKCTLVHFFLSIMAPDSFLKFILTFYWVMILDFEAIQASGSVFIQICVLDGLMFVNFQNMNADAATYPLVDSDLDTSVLLSACAWVC